MGKVLRRFIPDYEITAIKSTVVPVMATLSAAAEAANAIAVTLTSADVDGATVSRTIRYSCAVYRVTMALAATADFTITETGAGSPVSTDVQAQLLIDTSATGTATLTVTDVSGAFAGTVYLSVRPVGTAGYERILALTFA